MSSIRWRAVLVGFLASAPLAAALGLLAATAGWREDSGVLASLLFAAMMVGGFVAGRQAGQFGMIQGVAVASIYILISAGIKAWVEIDLATKYGPHVLGPMDMAGMTLGDLVYLVGATAGGWFADLANVRASRTRS